MGCALSLQLPSEGRKTSRDPSSFPSEPTPPHTTKTHSSMRWPTRHGSYCSWPRLKATAAKGRSLALCMGGRGRQAPHDASPASSASTDRSAPSSFWPRPPATTISVRAAGSTKSASLDASLDAAPLLGPTLDPPPLRAASAASPASCPVAPGRLAWRRLLANEGLGRQQATAPERAWRRGGAGCHAAVGTSKYSTELILSPKRSTPPMAYTRARPTPTLQHWARGVFMSATTRQLEAPGASSSAEASTWRLEFRPPTTMIQVRHPSGRCGPSPPKSPGTRRGFKAASSSWTAGFGLGAANLSRMAARAAT
mmetsp:Transcript_10680/g.24941  ORF Transcript_10680/g.24941 Transcript_10680/m.24941 type:complete len:311 (-) Transcript_10680:546-1478(-)